MPCRHFQGIIASYSVHIFREYRAADIIEDLIGLRPEVVLDPALLLSPTDWRDIEVKDEFAIPYVLTYFLGGNPLKEKSLKKNFLMNMILTGSQYIFPLITFPYVSRVLLAEGNGEINFALSVVNYFVLLASLGIPTYGVRACAVVREDKSELSRTVQELFLLNFITTLISFAALLASIILIPTFSRYAELIIIQSATLWLNLLGVDYMYQALEEYSYITRRSIGFKAIGVLLMFLFVHERNDVAIYAAVGVIGSSGSLLLNFFKARNYISFKPNRPWKFGQHLRPILDFFLLSASWTLFINFGSVVLGFMSNTTEVGYYAAAMKVKALLANSVSALGTVLLPRLSSYYHANKMDEFYRLLVKDSSFICVFGLYVVAFGIIDADQIILLLSGESYVAAVPAMRAIMLSVMCVGFSTLLGSNVLIPQGQERVTTGATFIGFALLAPLTCFLAPALGATGAAIATTAGELLIVMVEVHALRGDLKKLFNTETISKSIMSCLFALVVLVVFKLTVSASVPGSFFKLVLDAICFAGAYALFLFITREPFVLSLLRRGRLAS